MDITFKPTPKEIVMARCVAVKAVAEVMKMKERSHSVTSEEIIEMARPLAKFILSGDI